MFRVIWENSIIFVERSEEFKERSRKKRFLEDALADLQYSPYDETIARIIRYFNSTNGTFGAFEERY